MKIPLLLCLSTACVASLVTPRIAMAQDTVQPIRFNLVHVKPSLMVYWLDKAHHKLPEGISPREAAIRFKFTNNALDRGLPPNIQRIEADDATNEVIVYGTPEDAAIVATIARGFDRPINPLSFDEQRIQVATGSLASLGITFANPTEQAPLRVGQVNGAKVKSALSTLIVQNKAKVLSANLPTKLDQLAVDLEQGGTSNATLGILGEDGTFYPFFGPIPPGQTEKPELKVQMNRRVNLVSTLNDDKTASLAVSLDQTTQMENKEALPPMLASNASQSFKANVKTAEGDVIALVLPGETKNTVPTSTVVLLTPRVITLVAAIAAPPQPPQ